MLIMYSIIICIVTFTITRAIVYVICKVKEERHKRAFANLPREVLLVHAQMSPVYTSHYATMINGGVSKDRATELVTNRMLIDTGLIAYRITEEDYY